jgi:hypothetical protein
MGVFNFPTASHSAAYNEIVACYQRLRPIRLRLNDELVGRLSRDVLNVGGQRLGILRRGIFVFNSEDESCVLMDYCIYNVYRNGRNAIDQYLCDSPPPPDSDEMACLRAMQRATYAMVAVLRIEPGVGCHVRNLYTDEMRLLVDLGLSQTAKPGAVLATRLLDFGDFVATGGAALPLGVLDSDGLEEFQQALRAGARDDHCDPAPLIRAGLERGVSAQIRYDGANGPFRLDLEADSSPAGTSPQRRRIPGKRLAGKAAANRRCGCGSGKMYKNCCGKR